VGVGDLRKRLLLSDRRVVDQDANRAQRTAYLGSGRANGRAILGDEAYGDRLAAGTPNRVDRDPCIPLARRVGQCDGMSAGGERRGDRAADAAAAAGDQRRPSRHRASFRAIARPAASAIDRPVRPYLSASSAGSADAPNTSRTPTNSIGDGLVVASDSATAPPRPPTML